MTTIAIEENRTKICWSAVLAGTAIAVISGSLWNLLGIGLGFVLYKPDPNTVNSLAAGTVVWWFISALVSMGLGGWMMAKMSNMVRSMDVALNGLIVWALATIVTLAFMATAGGVLLGGALNTFNQPIAVDNAGQFAIASFFALIFGAGMAMLGAVWGAKKLIL